MNDAMIYLSRLDRLSDNFGNFVHLRSVMDAFV